MDMGIWRWKIDGTGMTLVTVPQSWQVLLAQPQGNGKWALLATRDQTGLLRPLTPDDEVAKLIEAAPRLRMTLQGARQAIADARDDAWGYDSDGDPDVPGGRRMWTKKEEYLFHIDAVLGNRPAGPEVTKLDLAWELVNALGGAVDSQPQHDATHNGAGAVLDAALKIIEELGGRDPAPLRKEIDRERQRREKEAHSAGLREARG